jgi:branched-chain amino acid transport system substrate-binding protein
MSRAVRGMGIGLVLLASACARRPPAPVQPPETPPARVPEKPAEPARQILRVGVIVSTTGPAVLRQYSDLVLQGARVATASAETARRGIELVVRDDGGTPAGAAAALRALEQAGITTIIGPLVEDALGAAAAARTNRNLVLISPTSVAEPAATNVFALNVVDTRGAVALAGQARRFARIGVLHARTAEGRRQANAFVNALPESVRGAVLLTPFDSGASNVSAQLTRLRQARVQVVYFPATERELQLVLPQIDYFGLRGVQLLGNESWIGDGARRLPQRVLQGAIVATPLWRESNEIAWSDFVTKYESTYRRTLPNPIPALGYDAVLLALRALDGGATEIAEFRGATGLLTMRGDAVTRRPFLVRIDAGRLVPVN